MIPVKEYVEIIKNYLKELDKASIDNIPILKTKDSRFDFSEKKLAKSKAKLKEICSEEFLPYKFMDGDIDKSSIVYILGLVIYNSLTGEKFYGSLEHNRVRLPYIYQFLNSALIEEDKDISQLLEIFQKHRDDIKLIKKLNNGYGAEIYSSVGLVRKENEDTVYAGKLLHNINLLIVADGMGGGEGGKIASTIAVNSCVKKLKSFDNLNLKTSEEIEELLKEIILEANNKIVKYAKNNNISRMGTTLTILLIIDNIFYIGHVGDSRAYLINDNNIQQLSEDHSIVEVLKRSAFKNKANKYSKNILAFALGKKLYKSNIFTKYDYLPTDSKLLLCSDGFWNIVDENDFEKDFDSLIDKILNLIPDDNVSFIRYSKLNEQKKEFNNKWYFLIGLAMLFIAIIYTIVLILKGGI